MDNHTFRYETEAMAEIRKLLVDVGHTDTDIDTFKACLISLENKGFALIRRQ